MTNRDNRAKIALCLITVSVALLFSGCGDGAGESLTSSDTKIVIAGGTPPDSKDRELQPAEEKERVEQLIRSFVRHALSGDNESLAAIVSPYTPKEYVEAWHEAVRVKMGLSKEQYNKEERYPKDKFVVHPFR